MKRSLMFTIDAGEETCGACPKLSVAEQRCRLFDVGLFTKGRDLVLPLRCTGCLAAEAKAQPEEVAHG